MYGVYYVLRGIGFDKDSAGFDLVRDTACDFVLFNSLAAVASHLVDRVNNASDGDLMWVFVTDELERIVLF